MFIFLFSVVLGIFFEFLMIKYLPKKSWYDSGPLYNKIFNQGENVEEELLLLLDDLEKHKKMNQTILGFIIIVIIILVGTFVVYIICSCNYRHEKGVNYTLLVFIIIFNFISLVLAFSILSKTLKIKKKSEGINLVDDIKSGIIKIILLLIAKIALGVFQIYIYKIDENDTCKNCCSGSSSTPDHIPSPSRNTQTTQPTTSRIITVQRQFTVRLKEVLSIEVYSKLRDYIEKGKKILAELVIFYHEMNFIGLTTKESISKEIVNIIVQLAGLLKYKGDKIIDICLESKEDDAMWLLLCYLFPYIILVIKLKIEKGIYRRISYVQVTSQVRLLVQLEKRVERDINGNIVQTFRFRQNISQSTLLNIIR